MPEIPACLRALAERWSPAQAHERGNAQLYLTEFCDALGVERPRPAGSGYEFELNVKLVDRDGTESNGFIDLWKADHFALEAKDQEAGKSAEALLRKAYGQVRIYATNTPGGAPPYLMVLDIGKTMRVWDRWAGSFGGFNAAHVIDLPSLHERPADIDLLRDIWEQPWVRDPRSRAVAVTKELAGRLAELAASLENRGHDQEEVARFLMRCVFTMFAEDVGLLPDEPMRRIIDEVALADPREFAGAVEELWRAMDDGRRFGYRKLLRFNGHFFAEAKALPLTRDDLALLSEAARAHWANVEPSIFGTLLVRAIDPEERHRLGAEYTPRAFIERVVRPTVEQPLRDEWVAVQAEVLQLRESGRPQDRARTEQRLREFHRRMLGLQFLDPACGSGNFLYVTMHLVKRIELEVFREIEKVTGQHALRFNEVGPWQFHGIEVKPWAREIAELTLWIGFHQFWREHHDVQPDEPILRDTETLECRDAVLAHDRVYEDPARAQPDSTPRILHPVTGVLVPDPKATLPYQVYEGARPADWPEADFIVGNPPYLGEKRQREVFGSGYVDALRAAYPDRLESADYVMYWWYKAAKAVASGKTIRAGFITTNTITQAKNRVVIEEAAEEGAQVAWAVADHPWVDEVNGAAVRVAMTVIARNPSSAVLVRVDDNANIVGEVHAARLNADLSAHADVPRAARVPLLSNAGLCWQGYKLVGNGFILSAEEAEQLIAAAPRHAEIIRPYLTGRDLTTRPRGLSVIDFGLRTEDEARAFPLLYDIVRDRVKPERDANPDRGRRTYWWRFGRTNENLRAAVRGLDQYIATVEVSRHRFFTFLDGHVAPDGSLVLIGSDDAFLLGVLSSAIHVEWALAAGGRLGVGNDPRYNKTLCFDAFPFADPAPEVRRHIADKARQIERHRREALARDERVTVTLLYNVLGKLRRGESLTVSERRVHEVAGCGTLRDLHDELDRLVAEAYGWSWPLERAELLDRLVRLHDARVAEEQRGVVRWLRSDYQIPRFSAAVGEEPRPTLTPAAVETDGKRDLLPWPREAVQQIAALKELAAAGPLTAGDAVRRFSGARRDIVERHLETLVILGELRQTAGGRYALASAAA